MGALLLLSVGLLAVGRGLGGSDVKLFAAPMTTTLLSSAGIGLIGVLWAYEGWQYVTFSAGETVDPQRTFPRGIVVGTALLIGIYLLANVGYIAALGPGGVVASKRVAADAAGSLFGVGLGTIVTPLRTPVSAWRTAGRRLQRSSTRLITTFISKVAKLAPRQRRVLPPNGSQV